MATSLGIFEHTPPAKALGQWLPGVALCPPPIVSLCIRAGWSLGGVKDRYLFRENAGDQHVGRCASCLDPETKEFAISPVYFDFSSLDAEEKIKRQRQINDFLQS